jgi:hypothetical protein
VSDNPALAHFEFDVTIERGKAKAEIDALQRNDFRVSPNPMKLLAEIESWVEDTAEEARCPFCTHPVKLTRIVIPQAVPNGANPPNIAQMLQQLHQGAQGAQGATGGGPFKMGNQSPNFGQNRPAIQAILDAKLSDQEILDILADVDIQVTQGTPRADLLQELLDYIYDT